MARSMRLTSIVGACSLFAACALLAAAIELEQAPLTSCPAGKVGFHELRAAAFQLLSEQRIGEARRCFLDAMTLYLNRVGQFRTSSAGISDTQRASADALVRDKIAGLEARTAAAVSAAGPPTLHDVAPDKLGEHFDRITRAAVAAADAESDDVVAAAPFDIDEDQQSGGDIGAENDADADDAADEEEDERAGPFAGSDPAAPAARRRHRKSASSPSAPVTRERVQPVATFWPSEDAREATRRAYDEQLQQQRGEAET